MAMPMAKGVFLHDNEFSLGSGFYHEDYTGSPPLAKCIWLLFCVDLRLNEGV